MEKFSADFKRICLTNQKLCTNFDQKCEISVPPPHPPSPQLRPLPQIVIVPIDINNRGVKFAKNMSNF